MNASGDPIRNQTLALGGVFQAADLVNQIGQSGLKLRGEHRTLIASLFKFDADSVEGVYGGVSALSHGLTILQSQLGGIGLKRDLSVARYTAQLLALQAKLISNSNVMSRIRDSLIEAEKQVGDFDLQYPILLARLAKIYTDNIGNLSPRILVTGKQLHLEGEGNANAVRAMLLSGVRSAVLWRQMGGSRWRLLYQRKKYLVNAQQLLEQAG